MKILIKVTKEIQRRAMFCGTGACTGARTIRTNCEVALAVIKLFPHAKVFQKAISFTGEGAFEYDRNMGDIRTIMNLPKDMVALPIEVSGRIGDFDRLSNDPLARLELPEYSFEIEVPDYVLNQIGIGQAYKVLSESKTLELVSI
jgi:hypothetical protein